MAEKGNDMRSFLFTVITLEAIVGVGIIGAVGNRGFNSTDLSGAFFISTEELMDDLGGSSGVIETRDKGSWGKCIDFRGPWGKGMGGSFLFSFFESPDMGISGNTILGAQSFEFLGFFT